MASGPRRFYRPELDALRFFAFLCVFGSHWIDYASLDAAHRPIEHMVLTGAATAGAFGVPLFFLLSAYLIIELLLREQSETGEIHVRSFYVRRILRIWPLYFLAMFGITALARLLPGAGPETAAPLLWFGLFAGNWYIARHGWIGDAFDPLWSISVEEQFYLVIPLLLKFGGRKVIPALSVVLIAIANVLAAHYAVLNIPRGESGEWVNSWFEFQFFAAGALLAISIDRIPRFSGCLRWAMFAAGVACWVFAVAVPGVRSFEAHTTVLGALYGWFCVLVGTVLLFLAVLGMRDSFVPEWLRYLGRISYGLYIFHALVFHLVFRTAHEWLEATAAALHLGSAVMGTVVVLILTVGLAAASYHFYERPFLKLKRWFTFVPSRPGDGDACRPLRDGVTTS